MFTPFVLNFLVRNLLQCVELNTTQFANQIYYHKNISIERCLEVGQKHQFAPDVTRNFTFSIREKIFQVYSPFLLQPRSILQVMAIPKIYHLVTIHILTEAVIKSRN